MIPVQMRAITANIADREVTIDGGWTAQVPLVVADDDATAAYARYYVDDFGDLDAVSAWRAAQRKAQATIARSYVSHHVRQLRYAVVRWAKMYAEMWPEHVATENGRCVLRGFDPEVLQGCYVPFDNFGRRGKSFVREILSEMGRKTK